MALAVQTVHSSRRGSRDIEHIGSGHDEAEAAARRRVAAGQDELDLRLDDSPQAGGPLEIVSSQMGHLWDELAGGYDALGFGHATGDDKVFRQLVLARIIEPTSKLDSLRVLAEVGRRAVVLPHGAEAAAVYATGQWRQQVAARRAPRTLSFGPLTDGGGHCQRGGGGTCRRSWPSPPPRPEKRSTPATGQS